MYQPPDLNYVNVLFAPESSASTNLMRNVQGRMLKKVGWTYIRRSFWVVNLSAYKEKHFAAVKYLLICCQEYK